MPAGTVLCLLPATDIRERERLAAVVAIFMLTSLYLMNIRAWRAARPPFASHSACGFPRLRDFRQFEELAGCFFQPAILCSTHHEALSVADFIMQVMPDIRFPVTDSDYPFLYLPSRSAIRSEACCQR